MRLNLVVEGVTEERFVKDVLAPHLGLLGVAVAVRVVATRRDRRHKGGGGTYRHLQRDLSVWMREDRDSRVRFSTLFDLYGLPRDFPEREVAERAADAYQKVRILEEALERDLGDRRLIAHVQLHEFEALLLADPRQFDWQFIDHADEIEALATLSEAFESPELIDDGPESAPSKRIIRLIPEFASVKASAGPIIAARIGLGTLRAKCGHFDAWVARLEALAESDATTP